MTAVGGEAVEPPVAAERLAGPALYPDGAGRQGGVAQGGVERRAGHRRGVPGVGETLEAWQADPTAGRPDHVHVADVEGDGQPDAEFAQQLQAPGTDEVAAGLVAGEGRLVEKGHLRPTPGEHQGGDAAGGTGAHDQCVEAGRAHAAPPGSSGYGEIIAPRGGTMSVKIAGDRNRFAQQLFTPLPERYDRLAEILSMGQNGRWRRAMVDHIVPTRPGLVLDVASGTAGVALQLADRTPAQVVGVDLTEQMLRQGQQNVGAAGMAGRVALVAGRAEQLPFADRSFDALTFTYLLRYVDDPQATLASWPGSSNRAGPWPAWSSSSPRADSGAGGGGSTPAPPSRPAGGSPGGASGPGSAASSAPTSRPTTAGTRWPGRSRPGAGPGSTTWGSG